MKSDFIIAREIIYVSLRSLVPIEHVLKGKCLDLSLEDCRKLSKETPFSYEKLCEVFDKDPNSELIRRLRDKLDFGPVEFFSNEDILQMTEGTYFRMGCELACAVEVWKKEIWKGLRKLLCRKDTHI